jgi:hypothetical protein
MTSAEKSTPPRTLANLRSVGPATIDDLHQLGVTSVDDLANQNAHEMYERLCSITNARQDPCVLDVFSCAIAQAKDPDLPAEQRDWWWWSGKRTGGRAGSSK